MNDGVEHKAVIGIDIKMIIVKHALLGEHTGIERYVVKLACQVEGYIRIDTIAEEGGAGGEDKAFVELLTSHGESLVA